MINTIDDCGMKVEKIISESDLDSILEVKQLPTIDFEGDVKILLDCDEKVVEIWIEEKKICTVYLLKNDDTSNTQETDIFYPFVGFSPTKGVKQKCSFKQLIGI